MSYRPISNQYGFQFLNDLLTILRLNQKAKHLKSKMGSYVLEQLLLLFVFDPHSGRIPSLSSESGACPLSIIKSMIELCSVLRDLACSLIDKERSEIQYDLILLHMKYAIETQQKEAYKQVHFAFQVYFYFYLTKRGKKFEDTKWTIRNRK